MRPQREQRLALPVQAEGPSSGHPLEQGDDLVLEGLEVSVAAPAEDPRAVVGERDVALWALTPAGDEGLIGREEVLDPEPLRDPLWDRVLATVRPLTAEDASRRRCRLGRRPLPGSRWIVPLQRRPAFRAGG